MCGLTGFWDPQGAREQDMDLLKQMTDVIQHRGPDDKGYWREERLGLGLGHRRLSILDLSQEGHQPMASADGRLIIAYNGEVYNFAAMAGELKAVGYRFRGGSDTEVLLAAIDHWGLEAAVSRFEGMFAFALYDLEKQRLTLVRDRLGIKPMYYSLASNRLLFGSELKSLMAYPGFTKDLDARALFHYLRLGYVPAPDTIFSNVRKLEQGHLIHFHLENGAVTSSGSQAYWHLSDVVDATRQEAPPTDEAACLARFRNALDQAVGQRLVADVPLGAFLSGGIDSSLVVASMQRAAPGSVKTFSIGFKDGAYNEATHAREIAAHLGTEHHELYLEEQQLLDLVPRLPKIWCEPFGDSSQLPTLLLAEFAREHVTVALSGDGGDELAAGYIRHQSAGRLMRYQSLPLLPRKLAGGFLRSVPVHTWDALFRLVPKRRRLRLPGDKLHKLGRALSAPSAAQLYREVVSLDTLGPLTKAATHPSEADHAFPWRMPKTPLTPAEDFMLRDSFRYLPDDMLTKVDRATMAASLEARVPLLDHRLMQYVWSLPESLKLRGGVGKWLLRETLAETVPRSLWDRPKMGFAAPVGQWLRTALKDWAVDLLDDVSAGKVPYLDPNQTSKLWHNHLAGKGNTTSPIWHLLMFLAWHREHLG